MAAIDDQDSRQPAAADLTAPLPAAKIPALGNAIWNWLGTASELLVALLLTPYLIRTLGDEAYGAWILLGALTGYLGVLDFGLRGSVGRHVAHYRARNDFAGLLNTLNTAAFALAIIGSVSLGIMSLLAGCLHWLPEDKMPAALLPDARVAMVIVGVQLAIFLLTRIFDATLWGYQRFDLLNMVDIPAALLRGVASAVVIGKGYGLVGLACVTLVLTTTVGVAKLLWCLKVEPRLRPRFAHVRLSAFRELWGFGFWNMLMTLGLMARTQLSPMAVEAALGLGLVGPFSVAMRLVGTAGTIMSGGVGVFAPFAVALHAHEDLGRQRNLFLETGKFCVGAAFFFISLFVFLGQNLLSLWIADPKFGRAWMPLVILACGELAPMSVGMAYNTIFGMARNRSLAFIGAAECATALSVGLMLSGRFGLNGMCSGLAIAATCWRGAYAFAHAARLIDLTLGRFMIGSVLPMMAAAAGPIAILATATWIRQPDTWPLLCLYTGVFSAVYVSMALVAAWGWSGIRARLSGARPMALVVDDAAKRVL